MNILEIDINKIVPNKNQPRKDFDQEKLEELALSIKEHGILQPIIVREIENGYEIVAGERRLRASKIAGLFKIPAIKLDVDSKESYEIAILENIQRDDLTPIEEAYSYKDLMEIYSYTQDQVAKKMGKQRSTITNKLRLLKLPSSVKKMLVENKITEGHARALLSLSNKRLIDEIANDIEKNKYSVRKVEQIVKDTKNNREKKIKEKSHEIETVEQKLQEFFETKVSLDEIKNDKGFIKIEYYDYEQLNRILEMLNIEID